MITKIGRRADGSILGEDDEGRLFVGTRKLVGFDALTRTVEDGVVTLKYGEHGQVVGKGNVGQKTHPDLAADGESSCAKQYHQVIVVRPNPNHDPNDPTSSPEAESVEARETKIEVTDWVAL